MRSLERIRYNIFNKIKLYNKYVVNEEDKLTYLNDRYEVTKFDNYLKIYIPEVIPKYKKCDTIVIGNYRGKDHAFLLQNMFPIIDKYIDHIDTVQGKALKVPSETRRIILDKVNKIFKLKQKGINLIFPDVDKIEQLLIEELKSENK